MAGARRQVQPGTAPSGASTPAGRTGIAAAPAPASDHGARLLDALQRGQAVCADWSRLVDDAVGLLTRPGFDTLVSLPHLRFEPLAYQLRAAQTALRMHGRAILADEVGLGKTIEAGLVLSELRHRGLAHRVLVLVPAGLVGQWQEELERKFGLPTALLPGGGGAPGAAPILLASLAAARRDPLRSSIVAGSWDAVVVDEAHRVRTASSASGRLVRDLRARHLLLLTATPIENRLDDLYQLVSLVRPGLLGVPQEFRARHGTGAGTTVGELPLLQARMREVLIRHRRSAVAAMLPRRVAETLRVTPGDDEADLYRCVTARVREQGRDARPQHRLALTTVQRMAGSTPAALGPTLVQVGWHDLAERAAAIAVGAKARAALTVIRRHVDAAEKVVVFTAFRRTLDELARLVEQDGIGAAVYHGGLTRAAKDAAIGHFREEAPVLLTTEAGGEGRNLQFCHVMVNVDLPWNPMQIEQRLGRIHRIGQTHDVLLTNLATRGTIEDRILAMLETKLNLFELVVGELDMVIGRVDDLDLESAIFTAHVESGDEQEFAARLDTLGDTLAQARHDYLARRGRTDQLLPDVSAL